MRNHGKRWSPQDDDEARARGETYRPLGMDCDRQAWELVRQAWIREGELP